MRAMSSFRAGARLRCVAMATCTTWRRSGAVGVLAIAVTWVGCSGEPALLRQTKKAGLVNNIQHELLESVDAEKSAVLATTDEESKAFADESRQSAAKICLLYTSDAA